MLRKPKIIVIVGPTASGKSELAVALAKKFNGEIISADSRQVYKGLNLGTGKVPGKWKNGVFLYKKVPHYCIDFVSPQKSFSASEFKARAARAIQDMGNRGKLPIIVGGTGFWIDVLIHDFELPKVSPNLKLRKQLAKKSATELFRILQKMDPQRAQTIDRKNPRRLLRAIEIVKVLGTVPKLNQRAPYTPLWIGTWVSKEALRKKIHKRLLARIREGMIAEGRQLRKQELSWKRFYELGLEYKFLANLLQKKISPPQMKIELERAILQYARRQVVWFQRNKKIRWISGSRAAHRLVKKFVQ